MSPTPRTATRLQLGAWAAALAVCALSLVRAVYFADDVAFVQRGGSPEWILAPMRQTADLIAVHAARPTSHTFVKRFDASREVTGARLVAHALRRPRIELNGRNLPIGSNRSSWRDGVRLDLDGILRDGRNELRVAVTNTSGPPMLQLQLETDAGTLLATDTSWQVVTPGANPVAAVVARDTAVPPNADLIPGPGDELAARWPTILTLFALGAAAALAWPRFVPPRWIARAPSLTLAAVVVFWVLHFFLKLGHMPMMVGFDLPAHLAYVDYLRERHALPGADYSFSSYHPPLFHLLATGVLATFDVSREGVGAALAHRALPALAGLASVVLTGLAARRLWPDEALRPSLAVAFAGLLPMNIYMSSYFSNESLHATWVSVAFYLAVVILLAPETKQRHLAALSFSLGLALLTKFTSLLVAPVMAGGVGLHAWWVEGRSPAHALARSALLLAGAALVAGWFYVRNWIRFGDPLVWNLNVPGEATWWMQPGFHTAAWYTTFGESLRHPYFAGFASFWDGVYSTFWGDGLAGGMVNVTTRHTVWRYDLMTLGYWLALPATALIGVGWLRVLRESLSGEDMGRRLLLSLAPALVFALGFSLLYITFSLPFYAQAKAFYVLAAIAPLSLVAAAGLAWLPSSGPGRKPWLRAGYFGYLATLAGTIVLTYLG